MILKNIIKTTVLCCLFIGLLSSCIAVIPEGSKYESAEELNSIYNDTFTMVSREDLSSTKSRTVYSTEKLQKNVSVISEASNKTLTSITLRSFSNYTALKYEEESLNDLKSKLAELYLTDEEYKVFSDNKFFLLIYNDTNTSYETLDYERKLSPVFNDFYNDTFRNQETIYLAIKSSAVTIKKSTFLNAAKSVFKNTNLTSSFKIMLVDDSVNLAEINNVATLENLYKSKKYDDCYSFTYDNDYLEYNWKEEK